MATKNQLTIASPFCIVNSIPKNLSKFIYTDENKQNDFLQNLIFTTPELIPIDELDPEYGQLVPIGKKVDSISGTIDLIFVNAEGMITIAETQVRSKKVPKILEYKTDIQNWDYDTFDKLSQNHQGQSLIELLSIEDENTFRNNITNNIKYGKFLMLIISERMNTYVEKIFDKFSNTKSYSHLGLVKLNIYKASNEDSFVIIPATAIANSTLSINNNSDNEKIETKANIAEFRDFSSDEEKFFNKLQERVSPELVKFAKQMATDTENIGCIIEWKPTSLIIKFPNPKNQKRLLTLFMIQIYGEVVQGEIEEQFNKYHYSETIAKNFINALIFSIGFKKGSLNLEYLKPNYKKFLDLIQDTLAQIKS